MVRDDLGFRVVEEPPRCSSTLSPSKSGDLQKQPRGTLLEEREPYVREKVPAFTGNLTEDVAAPTDANCVCGKRLAEVTVLDLGPGFGVDMVNPRRRLVDDLVT